MRKFLTIVTFGLCFQFGFLNFQLGLMLGAILVTLTDIRNELESKDV